MKFLPSKEQFEIIKQGVEEIIPESALIKKLENSKKLNRPSNYKTWL